MTDSLMVELPELRGYARYLDDMATDLGRSEALADLHCADTDFGKIVDDMTSSYAELLPQLHELLTENVTLMERYSQAVERSVDRYAEADDGVASRFQGDGIGSGNGVASFSRPASPNPAAPQASESELPEVSFGFALDKLCWALETFTGFDLRANVTDWIAGDTVGLSTQGSCWEIIGNRAGDIQRNLADGDIRIFRTWHGDAAANHFGSTMAWAFALQEQEIGFNALGKALKELAKEAVRVAQLVVDCIRLAIDLILSAWALQYIPVYGQAKFISKAWHAYKRANKAIAYLKMLASALRATKSLLLVLIDSLSPTMLPKVPASA